MKKKSVLFVCNGNVFRSFSAEYCLNNYLKQNGISNWKVSSAGLIASPEQEVDTKVLETLNNHCINKINHTPRRLNREILNSTDAVIAMAEDHVMHIKEKFGFKNVLLFNELAVNQKTSIWDIDEIKNYKTNRKSVEKKLADTVNYIHEKMPAFFVNLSERFYLFSDLISGEKTHRKDYPFIKLYETKNTIAFMSTDIPLKEDGHILVVPKQRYGTLDEVPEKVVSELAGTIKKIGGALYQTHGGYNVLLNNGIDAGQYIFHVHFHIIPRDSSDQISIENWERRKKLTKSEFIRLNNNLKEQIEKMN